MRKTIPVISIVGKSKSGKTTLLEKIIAELKRRNYRVATIKHHSHPGFDIDIPGKDTWRHAQAGSDQVIIVAPDKIANIRKVEHELSLKEITAEIKDVDIILTDGFKRARQPMIEVIRTERGYTPIADPDRLIAIATDSKIRATVPVFGLDDAKPLVDFIEAKFLK